MENTITDINIDMIGRRDEAHANSNNYVRYRCRPSSTDLDNITTDANKKYVQMELDYKYNDLADPNHFYERSDHYTLQHGVPSVLYLMVFMPITIKKQIHQIK
jgi:hypothetical protein